MEIVFAELLKSIVNFFKAIIEFFEKPIALVLTWMYRSEDLRANSRQLYLRIIWILFAFSCLIGGLFLGGLIPVMGEKTALSRALTTYYSWSLICGIPLAFCALRCKLDAMGQIIKKNENRGSFETTEYTICEQGTNSFTVNQQTVRKSVSCSPLLNGDGCLTIFLKGFFILFVMAFFGVIMLTITLILNIVDVIKCCKSKAM